MDTITVEPPLTATSLQRPLYCVPADTVHTVTQTSIQRPALLNGKSHYIVCPTAKITSRQPPVFTATDEKVKNGHQIDP